MKMNVKCSFARIRANWVEIRTEIILQLFLWKWWWSVDVIIRWGIKQMRQSLLFLWSSSVKWVTVKITKFCNVKIWTDGYCFHLGFENVHYCRCFDWYAKKILILSLKVKYYYMRVLASYLRSMFIAFHPHHFSDSD